MEILETATDPKVREMLVQQRNAWIRIASELETQAEKRIGGGKCSVEAALGEAGRGSVVASAA